MKIPQSQDERIETIATGQKARLVYAEVSERIMLREGEIVDRLVGLYRSGKLTTENMVGAIASIAEMRSLLSTLDSEIRQGLQASEREHAQAERYS